jgi:plastocyanin domain-containing protein
MRILIMKTLISWRILAQLGILLSVMSGAIAADRTQDKMQYASPQVQQIDQPISHEIAVTLGGLGLVGAELWWFLRRKPTSRTARTHEGIQEVTVIVDGGYEPSQVIVQAGHLVRLSFDRKDPSSCLEEIRIPDFKIAQKLVLNQITSIEFTPDKPGRYEFSCGMNMFRGVVEVQES